MLDTTNEFRERTQPGRRARKTVLGVLAASIALGLIGAAFFAGFQVSHRELPTNTFFTKVDRKLEEVYRRAAGPKVIAPKTYPTHLLRLASAVATVDFGAGLANQKRQHGGGMVQLGEDTLLLTHTGQIFAFSGPGDVRPTAVTAPSNGRAALAALEDDPAYSDYLIDPPFLRYNDLKIADTTDGRALIASYTHFDGEAACYRNRLAKLPLPAGATADTLRAGPDDWTILADTDPCLPLKQKYLSLEGHMAGGRIAIDGSTIYLVSSDFHLDGMRSDGPPVAQDDAMEYGKVLAIDANTGETRVITTGNRNMQGITFAGDDLYIIEHGPLGGDELNRVIEGTNYGWPRESFGLTYQATPIPGALSYGRHDTYEAPVFAWVPAIAPSDLTTVAPGFHDAWEGDLLIATLKDTALHRVRVQDGRGVYAERIEIGSRLRAVHQAGDTLVLWTDAFELIFLTASDLPNLEASFDAFTEVAALGSQEAASLRTAVETCAQCHSFVVDDHVRAPSLAKIHNDPLGATTYAGTSAALRSAGGTWTGERLAAYIADPQATVPGTIMPDPGVDDPDTIARLVDYLAHLDRQF
ncbi:MAG: PQQ-dependent sugar dehydrogenase [Pseudomonadota bacterium]